MGRLPKPDSQETRIFNSSVLQTAEADESAQIAAKHVAVHGSRNRGRRAFAFHDDDSKGTLSEEDEDEG